MRVGLVCSSGGHLQQLYWLKPWWSQHDRFWVTFDSPDARELLADEQVFWAHAPTNRNLGNLLRNATMAGKVLGAERPDVLVSNGAGVALPFFAAGWAMGVKLVWLEVYDRIDRASLTGRLVAPLSDEVLLMWEEQLRAYPHGVVLGPIR